MITRPVCNDIYLTTVFNSNILVTVTERGDDGTTVYDHVFENKGRKIKIIFNILDGPRREQVLPAEPESQLSRVKRAAEEVVEIKSIRDRLGVSVTYLEGLLNIGNLVKDVSHSSQTRPPTDDKYPRRSTHSLAFPLDCCLAQ